MHKQRYFAFFLETKKVPTCASVSQIPSFWQHSIVDTCNIKYRFLFTLNTKKSLSPYVRRLKSPAEQYVAVSVHPEHGHAESVHPGHGHEAHRDMAW